MEEQFVFEMQTDKPFEAVCERLEQKAPEHQFRVLAVHDVQETLAEKGFQRGPLKIIEVCNAGFAHKALEKESEVALFMPCRFTVHIDDDKTIVRLGRPTMISMMMPEAGLEELASSVEETLKVVMKESI